MDFASFFVQHIKHRVEQIILFGSVARGDFGSKSDIDIFINTKKKDMEKVCHKILDDFYLSVKYTKYWELLGIKNEISLKIGNLDDWQLKDSIQAHGIVLYGTYLSDIKAKPFRLFELRIKGKRNVKIRIWRKLYGYKQKVGKKVYENRGLIKELNGIKLSKATFAVPVSYSQEIIQFLRKNKVAYKVYNIWSDSLGQ